MEESRKSSSRRKKESLLEEGFPRIVICWFFDLVLNIEKSFVIGAKDNRILSRRFEIIFNIICSLNGNVLSVSM